MMVAMVCEIRRCRGRASGRVSHVISRRPARCRRGSAVGLGRHDGVGRYYDPQSGQFLSVDPLEDETGEPYSYTGGDPVNETDPGGETR